MSVVGIQGSSESVAETSTVQEVIQPAEQVENLQAQPEVTGAKTLDDKLSSKFAALSRKEKAIKAQEQQFRQQQSEMQKMLADLKSENERIKAEYSGYKTNVKQKPLQTLEEEGLTFEQLTQMQLNEQNPTTEMLMKQMRSELESGYKSELEALKKQLADDKLKAQTDAETSTITNFKKQIGELVTAQSDKYELINLNNAVDTVYEVVEKYYETEGKLLSVEEAADYVEKHLEDEANKIFKAKKFAARALAPKPTPSEKSNSVTLSNQLSAEVPQTSQRALSRDEQVAEASKTLRWG